MADEGIPVARLRTFLLEPDTFFRDLAAQPPRYREPLLIVLAAGIIYAVSSCLLTVWISSLIPKGFFNVASSYSLTPSGSVTGTDFISFVLLVSVPFLVTIIAGVVFHFHASLFTSNRGSLFPKLTAVGWGMVPLAAYYLLQIPVFLAFRPGMSATMSTEYSDGQAMIQMLTFSQPYYLCIMVLVILHILAWLCCAWFWIPAVRNTSAIDQRQAAFIVLVPVLIYLVYSFGPILVTAGQAL